MFKSGKLFSRSVAVKWSLEEFLVVELEILLKMSFDQRLKICSWQVLDSGRVHADSKDQEGTTPLMLVGYQLLKLKNPISLLNATIAQAAINGHAKIVNLLLDEGADPNLRYSYLFHTLLVFLINLALYTPVLKTGNLSGYWKIIG